MVENEHGMFVNTVLSSVANNSGIRIDTLHLRLPRLLLAELNTHRVFGRNSRSSRAVPGKSMFAEIETDPFVPWHWTANQRGMQGEKGHNALVALPNEGDQRPVTNREAWLWGRDRALEAAQAFEQAGYHKQVFNRLLEPFMWVHTLVTATDWANFLHLRDHDDAEPHIRDLAVMVREERERANPQIVHFDEWHLPYIRDEDYRYARNCKMNAHDALSLFQKVSAARCARISYAPFDGNGSYERELDRYDLLVGGGAIHASPLEHVAVPATEGEQVLGNLRGWHQFRHSVPGNTFYDA